MCSTRGALAAVCCYNDTATTEIYTLALRAALPLWLWVIRAGRIIAETAPRLSRLHLEQPAWLDLSRSE